MLNKVKKFLKITFYNFVFHLQQDEIRRDARVVEWDGLENRCTGNGTVGSNPTLSAIKIIDQIVTRFTHGFTHGICKTCVFLYPTLRRHFYTKVILSEKSALPWQTTSQEK